MVAIDTEDNSRGTPTLFCAISDTGSYTTRNRLDFLHYLMNQKGQDIWATNLEYDLVNVFGDYLPEVSLRFGHSALISARWKGLRFLDTLRHVPASVAQLGEWVGRPKLKFDPNSAAYCLNDAAITRDAVKQVASIYHDLGIEKPSGTLPATAIKIWRATWPEGARAQLPIPPVMDAAREAYYGGRVECFEVGEFRNVSAIDMSSAFPWAMITEPFPIPWGPVKRWKGGDAIEKTGFYRVRSGLEFRGGAGSLPFRGDDGLVFPFGEWEGTYTGIEILAHLQMGGRATVQGGFSFIQQGVPFRNYVDRLWTWKSRAQGVRRQVTKLLLNGLYGKFGERGDRTVVTRLEDYRNHLPRSLDTRLSLGMAITTVPGPPPPWANVVWAALVTARCRVRLLQELHKLRSQGARVLYVDTDGIFFIEPPGSKIHYPEKASKPGDWESRPSPGPDGLWDLDILGKKEYATRPAGSKGPWEYHAKGVPYAARETYIRNGHAEFERPNRLRESIRRGKQPNVWEPRTKDRRKILTKGKVKPIILG